MKVSVVTPTARRLGMLKRCIEGVVRQAHNDFISEIEHVIVYDIADTETAAYVEGLMPNIKCVGVNPMTVGEKVNVGCGAATGDIIVFMDDDDVFADDWVMKSVRALEESGADIVGIDKVYFYEPAADKLYTYILQREEKKWVCGGALCFRKGLWEGRRFDAVNVGYDNNFMFVPGTKVHAHGYHEGFVATIHAGNVSPKKVTGVRWNRVVGERSEKLKELLNYSRGIIP